MRIPMFCGTPAAIERVESITRSGRGEITAAGGQLYMSMSDVHTTRALERAYRLAQLAHAFTQARLELFAAVAPQPTRARVQMETAHQREAPAVGAAAATAPLDYRACRMRPFYP